jgi:prefoldin subunit 5
MNVAERQVNNATSIIKQGLAELARVLGSMIAIMTAFWFFAAPAVDGYIEQLVKEMQLASKDKVENIEDRVDEIDKREDVLGTAITRQGAQIDNIEKLAAEQRQLSTQILLELKNK